MVTVTQKASIPTTALLPRPKCKTLDLSTILNKAPKLSIEQAGHLRHFHNLSSTLPGEWLHMGSQEPGQEFLDAYRYQLATMAYAAGLAHYYHLTAMRSMFKGLMERLIEKMMRREVWGYWYLTSQSGKFVDPDLKEMRKPWADPVRRENIMFSGHLLLMISLYSMLFNDDKYDRDGALTFRWDPIFWGMGPEKFEYTRSTLQKAIVDEMERNNWMGVCCEPNSIFVVCNQFPLIAIRYNDVRNGTNLVCYILDKYQEAWRQKGMVAENGLLVDWYRLKQDDMIQPTNIGFTAWAGAFMNSWNSQQVKSSYPSQSLGFLTRITPTRININPSALAHTIRNLVHTGDLDPNDPRTIKLAKDIVSKLPQKPQSSLQAPTFGYVCKWVSELGDTDTLQGLLNHADQFLNPKWENGGLFFPRCDEREDEEGNWTFVDPFTGNAAIGYARLNVKDGQKGMWEKPWTRKEVEGRPWVDGVGFEMGVDVLRGDWVVDGEVEAMVMTVRTWDGGEKRITPMLQNLPAGRYDVYINGHHVGPRTVDAASCTMDLDIQVSGSETDLVVLKN